MITFIIGAVIGFVIAAFVFKKNPKIESDITTAETNVAAAAQTVKTAVTPTPPTPPTTG